MRKRQSEGRRSKAGQGVIRAAADELGLTVDALVVVLPTSFLQFISHPRSLVRATPRRERRHRDLAHGDLRRGALRHAAIRMPDFDLERPAWAVAKQLVT